MKPPWSTKAFVRTVCKTEHHDVGSFGSFEDEFGDKRPWYWTKQASKSLERAMELYMVEVTADSHP